MDVEQFFQDFPEQQLPAGTQIFRQGDPCGQYFILTSGSARVYTRSANGKEVLLYSVNPGSVCVLTTSCLLGKENFPAEAIAETNIKIRILNKPQFDQLMTTSSEFRQFILAGFGERMNGFIQTIQKLALESVEEKLAKYLLKHPDAIISKTHKDIAEEISSAREVVSRHLKRLEKDGLVQLQRGEIKLINRNGLLRKL